MSYSVFIIEPTFLVRKGYQHIFDASEDIECVGMAAGPEQALEEIPEVSPDLVITEIFFEGNRHLDVGVIRRLKALRKSRSVLVVSMAENTHAVVQALKAGADGYLIKWEAGEQLISAIHEILGGEAVLSPPLDRPEIRAHLQ